MLTDEQITNEVAAQYPTLEYLTEPELREKVEEFAITEGLVESLPPGLEGVKDFLNSMPQAMQAICRTYRDHKFDNLPRLDSAVTLVGIIGQFLPPEVNHVPLGITALALLIIHRGLEWYCRDIPLDPPA